MSAEPLLTLAACARAVGRKYSTVQGWVIRGALKPAGKLWCGWKWVPGFRLADARSLSEVRNRDTYSRDEPTAEEVESLVAEQMRPENLPAWWKSGEPDIDPEGDE